MKPFVALIGPPRIAVGLVALAYGTISIAFESILQGGFDVGRSGAEILSLGFAFLSLGQEGLKAYLRPRFTIVEMDNDGLFDCRIMKHKLLWADVEWVDPHPGGVPDRLRVMGNVELTTFGDLRNFLIRTIRTLPKGETIITFSGLSKAGAQAIAWIADTKTGLVPDVWKSAHKETDVEVATQHSAPLISASVYWREWVGGYVSGIVLLGLVAALSPALVQTLPVFESFSGLSAMAMAIAALALTIALWTAGFGFAFWLYNRCGDSLIVISEAGFSDTRVSAQFVSWSDVESVTFEYRNMGRLINETIPVSIQFREGLVLEKPASKLFWPREFFRRATTGELVTLQHRGTTTSVSEIIETIQRHNIPVALREIARG